MYRTRLLKGEFEINKVSLVASVVLFIILLLIIRLSTPVQNTKMESSVRVQMPNVEIEETKDPLYATGRTPKKEKSRPIEASLYNDTE